MLACMGNEFTHLDTSVVTRLHLRRTTVEVERGRTAKFDPIHARHLFSTTCRRYPRGTSDEVRPRQHVWFGLELASRPGAPYNPSAGFTAIHPNSVRPYQHKPLPLTTQLMATPIAGSRSMAHITWPGGGRRYYLSRFSWGVCMLSTTVLFRPLSGTSPSRPCGSYCLGSCRSLGGATH